MHNNILLYKWSDGVKALDYEMTPTSNVTYYDSFKAFSHTTKWTRRSISSLCQSDIGLDECWGMALMKQFKDKSVS